MFVVSRHKGQKITIGDDIEVTILEVSRSTVKLGIMAPKATAILRSEVRESIELANRQAANTTVADVESVLSLPLSHTPLGASPSDPLHGLGISVTSMAQADVKDESSG